MRLLWSFSVGAFGGGITFSENGNLGAAISERSCAYVLNPNCKILNEICGDVAMTDASYSNGKFGFRTN